MFVKLLYSQNTALSSDLISRELHSCPAPIIWGNESQTGPSDLQGGEDDVQPCTYSLIYLCKPREGLARGGFLPVWGCASAWVPAVPGGQCLEGTGGDNVALAVLPGHLCSFWPLTEAAPLVSPRTLMGPYGMDRTVHCFDFYDCANGLGEYQGQQGGLGHLKRPPSPQSLCQDVPPCVKSGVSLVLVSGTCLCRAPFASFAAATLKECQNPN